MFESNVNKNMKKKNNNDKRRNPPYLLAYLLALIVKGLKFVLSRVGGNNFKYHI